jgi:xanthine dehydrogenase accessory factor
VGLALSEVLSLLDFEIHILDHRENLNTMEANHFARTKQVVDFEAIDQYIPEGDDRYVIIMSFGYRTDDVIIRRLLGRKFKYIGMLGSKGENRNAIQKSYRRWLCAGRPGQGVRADRIGHQKRNRA